MSAHQIVTVHMGQVCDEGYLTWYISPSSVEILNCFVPGVREAYTRLGVSLPADDVVPAHCVASPSRVTVATREVTQSLGWFSARSDAPDATEAVLHDVPRVGSSAPRSVVMICVLGIGCCRAVLKR